MFDGLSAAIACAAAKEVECMASIPKFSPKLEYCNEIENELKNRNINYRFQTDAIWIHPKNTKNYDNCCSLFPKCGCDRHCKELLIPGSKSYMLKSFIAIRLSANTIIMNCSSNRMVFPCAYKNLLNKFCNFLNSTAPLCQFFVSISNSSKVLLSARRTFYKNAKVSHSFEFIDELVSFDKLYQMALLEHLPHFLMKFQTLTPLLEESVQSNYEESLKCVCKVIKGIGFNQSRKNKGRSPLGQSFNVISAINVDPDSNGTDWKVLPIDVEITDYFVTIKIKLCKNKCVLKFDSEKVQNLMCELINYINLDLKRVKFKLDFLSCALSLEGIIAIFGLDYTEIQAGFQDLFSYSIETFKKYGELLMKIYNSNRQAVEILNSSESDNIISQQENQAPLIAHLDVLSFYQDFRKFQSLDSREYSQFLINSSSKVPVFMIIPQKFESRKYKKEAYQLEKDLVEKLKISIEELYHCKWYDKSKTIRYPQFNGSSIKESIGHLSANGMTAINEFAKNIHKNKFRIENIIEALSCSKEQDTYVVYFSKFPLHQYISFVSDGISKHEQQEISIQLTKGILNTAASSENTQKETLFLEIDSFDFIDPSMTKGILIDTPVEFIKINHSKIKEISINMRRNFPYMDKPIGFLKAENEIYLVTEQVFPLEWERLPKDQIKIYFTQLINSILLLTSFMNCKVIITPKDLYINHKEELRIRLAEYDNDHLWSCFDRKRSNEGKIVYSLALLLYNILLKCDPFYSFADILPETLKQELANGMRIPIVPWEYEMENPRMAAFLKQCFIGEIESLEDMKNRYPLC